MQWIVDLLFPPREDERLLRSVAPGALLELLAPRMVPVTSPGTLALLPFHDAAVRATIHEAKYHGSRTAFDLLSTVLVEYLLDGDLDLSHARLVPIPLGTKRRKERGFNQTEEIAMRVSQELGIPLDTETLTRVRETASQVSLPREKRSENMRDAFGVARPPSSSLLYIVVDDVTTTGATLQAALDALSQAGARNLFPLALAH